MVTLADAAVLLASRGYRVFPVAADKAPLTPRGHLDGSSDETTVRGMPWREDGGIGLVVPDRWMVVDVDPRNGGGETILALHAARHKLPITRTVMTRSGGRHYYLTLPDDRDIRGKLGPGVDVKKPGRGYVLVPPTAGYMYLRGGAPAPAPEWLLEELTLKRRAVGDFSKPKFFPFMIGSPYGKAALAQKLTQVRETGEGGRRATINTVAFVLGRLVAGGELDEERTLNALLDAALDVGLTEAQALSAMKSGWDAGLQQPWSAE